MLIVCYNKKSSFFCDSLQGGYDEGCESDFGVCSWWFGRRDYLSRQRRNALEERSGYGAYYQRASTVPHIARVVRGSLSGGEPVFTVTALVVARVDGMHYLEPNDSFVLDHATGRAEMVALNIPFVFQLVDID